MLGIFFHFSSFLTVQVSFCSLIKGISMKICILCVRVKINKRSFEPFCVWIKSFKKKKKKKKKKVNKAKPEKNSHELVLSENDVYF